MAPRPEILGCIGPNEDRRFCLGRQDLLRVSLKNQVLAMYPGSVAHFCWALDCQHGNHASLTTSPDKRTFDCCAVGRMAWPSTISHNTVD